MSVLQCICSHRVGIYQYMSPECLTRSSTSSEITNGTTTAEEVQLLNGFSTVHTNSPSTQAQHYTGSARSFDLDSLLQTHGPSGQPDQSKGDKRRRKRLCKHPESPITAPYRRGRYRATSHSTPKKIQTIMGNQASALPSDEDRSILMAYKAMHSPAGGD